MTSLVIVDDLSQRVGYYSLVVIPAFIKFLHFNLSWARWAQPLSSHTIFWMSVCYETVLSSHNPHASHLVLSLESTWAFTCHTFDLHFLSPDQGVKCIWHLASSLEVVRAKYCMGLHVFFPLYTQCNRPIYFRHLIMLFIMHTLAWFSKSSCYWISLRHNYFYPLSILKFRNLFPIFGVSSLWSIKNYKVNYSLMC
jgi:hypothetical protein